MEQLNYSVVTSNISFSPGHPPPASWDSSGLVPAVVLSVCFLLGVSGNIAVIILRPNWEHMSSLMLNLAISDVLCLITLPLWVYALMLSIQRYLQVVRLQKFLDQRGRRRLLVLLWLVATILSSPALVVRQLKTVQHWTICQPHYSSEARQVAMQQTKTLIGFVSVAVVALSYIVLYRKVDQAAFYNNPQTTRLVTAIVVTYFVFWMPYHTVNVNVLGVAAVLLKNEGLLKISADISNIAKKGNINTILYYVTEKLAIPESLII